MTLVAWIESTAWYAKELKSGWILTWRTDHGHGGIQPSPDYPDAVYPNLQAAKDAAHTYAQP